ncbi:MAG: hypothetical protein A2Y10_07480 [Planctomycetes bacterium GWF2_41_51]|nr:MAG: hypothetical protein A2Y10_07480 [Planctomycetes bacterium GWF2_41_51]
MSSDKTENDRKTELHKKAENKFRKKYSYLHNNSTEKSTKITPGLLVHQIELEMQNEELRKAQIELEESRYKNADLHDFAPVGYFVIDGKGAIAEVNLNASAMLGMERNKLLNKPFSLCICKESQDIFYLNRREVFETGASRRCELKMIREKDTEHFFAELILDPITNDSGKTVNCRIAMIDITQRKKMEDELHKNRQDLEKRVKEKTSDLLEVVNLLRGEIEQRKKAELTLQKQTRDLDAFFSGSINPLVILDSKFNIIRLNKAYADAWGRNISDFTGRNYFEFCTCEENKRIYSQVVQSKKPHQAAAMPFIFPDHPELGVTYWDWNLVPVLDESGNVELLALSLKNVTENIKVQKALEENEKKYRTLVEVSPEAICVVVADKIVFANQTAVRILKAASTREIIGKSIWRFVHPDSLAVIKEKIERYQKNQNDIGMVEVTIIRTDRSLIESEVTIAPVDYEAEKGLLIIFQDISLRKKQETDLKRIKFRLDEAQRIAHLGNWDWDIINNSLWLSDESYRIFGIEHDKFEGRYARRFEALLRFVHPEDRQLVKQTVEESIAKCKTYDIEHRIIRPDGVQRFVHKRAEVECDPKGKALKMVGTIQDVTEQKKAETQLLLSRLKWN